jgi:acylpyruvate hydrolase
MVQGETKVVAKVDEKLLVDLNLAYECLLQEAGDPHAHEIASIRIPKSMLAFLEGGEISRISSIEALSYAANHRNLVSPDGRRVFYNENEVKFTAAIPRPNKLLHIGVNNRGFLKVMMDRVPPRPMMFQKANSSVIADGEDIVLMPPDEAQLMTTEVEVGVIIGKRGRMIPVERALEHVFGYVVVNDITAQDRTDLFDLGDRSMGEMIAGRRLPTETEPVGGHNVTATIVEMKNYDTWLPMGRFIVTRDEVRDPDNLVYKTIVDGNVVQEGGSWDLELKTAPSIAAFSRILTLEPGDVICTGTVGLSKEAVLKPGIMLTSFVEEIGSITNRCVPWSSKWKEYTKWDDLLRGTAFSRRKKAEQEPPRISSATRSDN